MEFMIERHIAREPAGAFAYISDPAELGNWQTNTVSAVLEGDGPMQLGARVREVHRAPGGKELASTIEVVEYQPDRVFALKVVNGALPVDARIILEPNGSGTTLTFAAHGEMKGIYRVVSPVLRATLKRQFGQHCDTLKRILEADSPTGA